MTNSSVDNHVNLIVKRYSSLFTLPSHGMITLLLSAVCMIGGVLAIVPWFLSYDGLVLGISFGVIFLSLTLVTNFVINRSSMKNDPVFNLRRCSALSLFSWLVWFGVIFVGRLITMLLNTPNLWVAKHRLGLPQNNHDR